MKPNQILIALLAGAALMTACKKDDVPPSEKDAVVQISVRDQKGTPINGTPVLIYDEEGYAKFQKEHNTPPLDVAVTRADGNVEYRFAYDKWLTSGKRTVTFVVYKEQDEKNYDIWSETRTSCLRRASGSNPHRARGEGGAQTRHRPQARARRG